MSKKVKAENSVSIAEIRTAQKTLIEAWLTSHKRDTWAPMGKDIVEALRDAYGVSPWSFNSYIPSTEGRAIGNVALVAQAIAFSDTIKLMMQELPSDRTFYATTGKGGETHGGLCELFTLPLFDGKGEVCEVRVLRHLGSAKCDNGTFVIDGMIRHCKVMSRTEVLEKAHKRDIRQFKIEIPDVGERVYSGALFGNMSARRQAILIATDASEENSEGLALVDLHCGRKAKDERCNRAVEIPLTNDERENVAKAIFTGSDIQRGKSARINHARKTRATVRKAIARTMVNAG